MKELLCTWLIEFGFSFKNWNYGYFYLKYSKCILPVGVYSDVIGNSVATPLFRAVVLNT